MSQTVLKISPLALLLGTWGLEFVKKQPGQEACVPFYPSPLPSGQMPGTGRRLRFGANLGTSSLAI